MQGRGSYLSRAKCAALGPRPLARPPIRTARDFNIQSIEVLKLDIETAEYDVIEQMMRENIWPKILCVEYDEGNSPLDGRWRTRIRDSVRALKDYGYALCYVDAFNFTFIDDSRVPSL